MSTETNSKKYVKMSPEEKEQVQKAKAEDERFVGGPSRITTGAYLALLAQERLESNEGER